MPIRKLNVKDLQVNVSISGEGPPLLLLNGLGGLIRTFDALPLRCCQGHAQRQPTNLLPPASRFGRLDQPAAATPFARAHAHSYRRP